MFENFVFSLHATIPVFLLMVLGYVLHQIGWMDDGFASKLNKLVFRLPLPMLVFSQLATTDFITTWDGGFVLFCFGTTILSILGVSLLSLLLRDRASRGEFIQAAYRSSAALLGIAYIQNIYNDATMSALMILGAVPLYNIMAVVVLTLTAPAVAEEVAATKEIGVHKESGMSRSEEVGKSRKKLMQSTLRGIITNPILIGIVAGLLWSLLDAPMPQILGKCVGQLGDCAAPLGLIAMGASIKLEKVRGQLLPSVGAALLKLFGLCAIFLPIAVFFGFRDQKLVAILIMLGSATTVSSFVMAKSMGHEGTLTSNTVVLTTLGSSVSLTFWIFLLRSMGVI